MNFFEILNIIVDIFSLSAIVITLYVFFTDDIRRWSFLGYKPTAILLVFDNKTKKVLLINKDTIRNLKREYAWYFPQGGIYSSDLNTTVATIMEREFNAGPFTYDFTQIHVLGKKRIKNRAVDRKQYIGAISLFSSLKGKGYIACILHTDMSFFKKNIQKNVHIGKIRLVTLDQALNLIDPEKAKLLKKVKKNFLI